ncbi:MULTISPECIES: glycosyltransferase family 4 protein [Acidiferrobacter]|uniref:glycosyltransferase family 4 protein n=1 Tax=Acidiferrobacter TaxID=986106 RepID=UPI00143D5458|nr:MULTISPECIES: glycosyltransferase family 1 protein [Acidiferrobacter]
MTFKIAVDACSLYRPLTGVGRYTHELCRELSQDLNTDVIFACGWRWQRDFPVPLNADTRGRIEAIRAGLPGGQALIYGVKALAYRALARYHRPNVVFAPGFLIPPLAVPTVITVHDLSHIRFPETHPAERLRLFLKHLGKSIARAAAVLTISQFSADEIVREFPDVRDRLHIIAPGVRDIFTPNGDPHESVSPLSLPNDSRPFFLFLATLEPRKNLGRLLAAYAQLPARMRAEYRLVIAGQIGWKMDDLAGTLQQMVRAGEVQLLGHVRDQDLPGLYRRASALVYPSLYEGFGLPPLEAMACGCVTVVATTSAIPEACGDAGLYVDPWDTEGLAAAMIQIVEDTALRATLRERGFQRARLFRWEEAGRQLRTVLVQAGELGVR